MRQLDQRGGHPLCQHHERYEGSDVELIVGGYREIHGQCKDAGHHQPFERGDDGLDHIGCT
jgi:hypothetical protein